ncbi:Uncharacterised protein [Mycobacteroides abscessus subsp. abscessus]|nr:Uncharacterised protein [Mycobacteroides abscessus subsp. abscessus]
MTSPALINAAPRSLGLPVLCVRKRLGAFRIPLNVEKMGTVVSRGFT